ncbi:MAG: hypothetical protein EPO68_08955 [Planctomycetota bacterium]|nr:MAG: hypothetical protein EPO68_08955 [Planctomycetota bacterium]
MSAEPGRVAPSRGATWPRLLGVWGTIACAGWFLVSFARRDGGSLDGEQLYAEWFGARPARVALGAARVDTSGARVLDLELDPAAGAAGEPQRLVLWQATEPGPILAAFGDFQRFEQPRPDDAPSDDSKDGAAKKDGGAPQWREIERGDLSYGAWTSAYVRLRKAVKDQPDRDQIRVNLSDQRRFALLIAEWAPGAVSALDPLEKLLDELAVKAEVAAPQR